MATYAISDLHGQYNMFLKLLEKVEFSDKDELYMLGDAIDRGPDGVKMTEEEIIGGADGPIPRDIRIYWFSSVFKR